MTDAGPGVEFDRQVEAYITLGVPEFSGRSADGFTDWVTPLRALLAQGPEQGAARSASGAIDPDAESGRLPYVLVLPGAPAEDLMPLTRQGEHPGYVDMNPVDSRVFRPVTEAQVPAQPYLAMDVDTGRSTLGVTPQEAGRQLVETGRLPLTIDEGIAALLLNPGLLRSANCFQMLASRDGSKRIPSLWVTGRGRPRLGWCFDRVPHTWLGAASCAERRTV